MDAAETVHDTQVVAGDGELSYYRYALDQCLDWIQKVAESDRPLPGGLKIEANAILSRFTEGQPS
jgi:hypothetical protein